MSTLRLVLFDMDDVLCAYDWPGRICDLARLSGRAESEIVAGIWHSGFENLADTGQITSQAYVAGFAQRLGVPFSRADWLANRAACLTPWPAMLELVRSISRQAEIAILTNNNHLIIEEIDMLFPALRPLFGPRILSSAELGLQKPDPAAYLAALDRLGFRPGETLFTDDRSENVEGAITAGLHGHVHSGPDGLRARIAELGLLIPG
ncbi:MAG: HAD family phosphatase [Hyphomicrobiales bacterium]|nr:HAD family phosphatase [Hyphomicrobiales bacterium]